MFLRNSTHLPPFLLTIPGCETFCELNKLIELTRDVVPENWEEECASNDSYVIPPLAEP